jgi:hypothetical protein
MDPPAVFHARMETAAAAIAARTSILDDDGQDTSSSSGSVPPPPDVNLQALLINTAATATVAAAAALKARARKRRIEAPVVDVLDSIPQLLLLHPDALRVFMPVGALRLEWTRPIYAHKTVCVPASEWPAFVAGLQQVCVHPALRAPTATPASHCALPLSTLGTARRVRSHTSVLAALASLYGTESTRGLNTDDTWVAKFTLAGKARVVLVIDGVKAGLGMGLMFSDSDSSIGTTDAPAAQHFFVRGPATRVAVDRPWAPTSGAYNVDTGTTIDFDVGGWTLPAYAILSSVVHYLRTTIQATSSHRLRVSDSVTCPGDSTGGVVFKATIHQLVAFMQRVFVQTTPMKDAKDVSQRLCASLTASQANDLVQLLQHVVPRTAFRTDGADCHLADEGWGVDAINGELARAIAKSKMSAAALRAIAQLIHVPMPSTISSDE